VRLVRQLRAELGTEHGTVHRVAKQLGYGIESVRSWVRQADIDEGVTSGTTTADVERIKRLEQENRELRRANEILKRVEAVARIGGLLVVDRLVRDLRVVVGGVWRGSVGQDAAGVVRQSLRRLWVAVISFHSLLAASSPRRDSVRIRRLCLICANTGSIVAARFL
jgi:transposase